jgi:hypothetical protein
MHLQIAQLREGRAGKQLEEAKRLRIGVAPESHREDLILVRRPIGKMRV